MTDDSMHEALIVALQEQADDVQEQIDALLADMEAAPADERKAFGPRFVELMQKHGELGRKLISAGETIKRPGNA